MKRSKKRCGVKLDEDSCKISKSDATDTSLLGRMEIYNFNHNSYREIENESANSISLHPTKRLVALCSPFGPNSFLRIYTLDGFFVTSVSLDVQPFSYWSSEINIHFTDDMIVMSGKFRSTTRYNDYNVKQNRSLDFLSCDKDGFIYAPIFEKNAIGIYSHDLKYLEKFDAYNSEYGEVMLICIREDTMVILSFFYIYYHKDRFTKTFTIQRYDLSKKIILQTVKFNHYFMSDPKYLCLDPLDNAIISNNSPNKLAVWYSGGRVRYYHPNNEANILYLQIAVTEDFQMFRCTHFGHKLRVYELK